MIAPMYLAIVLALVLVNGLFAMSEIAVVSANRFRLQQRAAEGDRAAARALALAENPDRFRSTVQVGITLVAVVSGASGGATRTAPVADAVEGVATGLAGLMHGLSLAARPVVWLLAASTRVVLRLLRVQDGSDAIDEEDIELVIAHGREAGVVEPEEQVIVERAFWLGERRVN